MPMFQSCQIHNITVVLLTFCVGTPGFCVHFHVIVTETDWVRHGSCSIAAQKELLNAI